MKVKTIFKISLAFLLIIFAQSKSNGQDAKNDGYILIWEDEFDKGFLDTTQWNVEVHSRVYNDELEAYCKENVTVGEEPESGRSCLVLTARKQVCDDKQFTSGRLNTKGKFEFKFGKVEARIKFPDTADGLWPAFWLLGHNGRAGWPLCGEIDMVEIGHVSGIQSGRQAYAFNGACHWGCPTDGRVEHLSHAAHHNNAYSLEDDFHLYTMIWDENSIKMYLDQDKHPKVEPYLELDISDMSDPASPGPYFHHPFYLVADLAVGGQYTGILSPEGITALKNGPRSMYIDYIKVYQPVTSKTDDK
jgi:beta-glucanase (GH16 family)